MDKIRNYFKRIGLPYDLEITRDFKFLSTLQYNHVTTIPYENIDLINRVPIIFDIDKLYDKVVNKQRGGYCFELNMILSWMLKKLGFEVRDYFARYLRGEEGIPLRRHRVLVATCDDGDYLCDVGVGQSAPRWPIKMEEGLIQEQFGETYKLEKDDFFGWVLYDLNKGEWRKIYSFTEELQTDMDYMPTSYYYESHWDSGFNKFPIIAIKTLNGRKTINDRCYKAFENGELTCFEDNLSDERFTELMAKEFNVKIENWKYDK